MLDILFEDNHLIAVNKRPKQLVQVDKSGDVSLEILVKEYIKQKYQKPGDVFLGVIHRIDRPVSGVTLFARTSKALARMNEMMQQRQMKKTYWAIVKTKPPQESDTLVHFLKRNEKQNKTYVVSKDTAGAQQAQLTYKLIGESKSFYLLEIDLHTGRHHQIRTQLAAVGCPIRGDLKYGFDRSNADGSISLHAVKMEFLHPVKKEKVSIEAPPPHDSVWEYFKASFQQ